MNQSVQDMIAVFQKSATKSRTSSKPAYWKLDEIVDIFTRYAELTKTPITLDVINDFIDDIEAKHYKLTSPEGVVKQAYIKPIRDALKPLIS